MKRHHDSKYQLCEHQTNQRTDIVVQACMTVNPDNTSPILHLIWRFVSPIDSKPQYFASIQSFPSDFLLTSTIHTLQLSTFSKLNSLTGRSQTMISIICLYSTSSQSEDIQWSIFRIKLYPFESLDEDDGENQGVWFEDITSLVVSDDDKAIETISLSQLVPLVQPLPNVIEQRCIPSMVNMNACDLLYAPSRGVSAVVLSKDILPEGVVLFDMEENEEEEEEDGDEEEKEEKETLSEEDNDDMMI